MAAFLKKMPPPAETTHEMDRRVLVKRLLIGTTGVTVMVALGLGSMRFLGAKKPAHEAPAHAEKAEHGEHASVKGEHPASAPHENADNAHHAQNAHEDGADVAEVTEVTESDEPIVRAHQRPKPSLAERALTFVFGGIQRKVDELRRADEENARLVLENAHLRLKLEAQGYEFKAKSAKDKTYEIEERLQRETGSGSARTLASINYQIPDHLMPDQLLTLGTQYFKSREDEKAASILTFLVRLDNGTEFRTPPIYLMTAVAWYRLNNFQMTEMYLNKVLSTPESAETLPYHAQARLWMALAHERAQKHPDSQAWLKQLVDYHPKSTEASWINTVNGYAESRHSRGGSDTHAPDTHAKDTHATDSHVAKETPPSKTHETHEEDHREPASHSAHH